MMIPRESTDTIQIRWRLHLLGAFVMLVLTTLSALMANNVAQELMRIPDVPVFHQTSAYGATAVQIEDDNFLQDPSSVDSHYVGRILSYACGKTTNISGKQDLVFVFPRAVPQQTVDWVLSMGGPAVSLHDLARGIQLTDFPCFERMRFVGCSMAIEDLHYQVDGKRVSSPQNLNVLWHLCLYESPLMKYYDYVFWIRPENQPIHRGWVSVIDEEMRLARQHGYWFLHPKFITSSFNKPDSVSEQPQKLIFSAMQPAIFRLAPEPGHAARPIDYVHQCLLEYGCEPIADSMLGMPGAFNGSMCPYLFDMYLHLCMPRCSWLATDSWFYEEGLARMPLYYHRTNQSACAPKSHYSNRLFFNGNSRHKMYSGRNGIRRPISDFDLPSSVTWVSAADQIERFGQV